MEEMQTKPQPQQTVYLDELIQPLKLVARKSPLQGYGVFAKEDIKEGELLEQATFARTYYRSKHIVSDEIRQICYTMPCPCETCQHAGRNFVLSSGYIDLYNSSKEDQNVKFDWAYNNRVIQVYAIKDIPKDSELLHFYGENYNKIEKEVF